MSVKFNPISPTSASAIPAAADSAAALSGLMMAPVSLTPLTPPSSVMSAAARPSDTGGSIAADRRQIYFSGQQKALLERLSRTDASPMPVQGGALSVPQRAACIAVLQNIATAVASAE